MTLPNYGDTASPTAIARVAREAEEMGLDSIWVMDRLLRPLRAIAMVPGVPPQPLPEYYANVYDPVTTLSYVAAITERIQLGTSAINALLHPPVVLGKRLATLDQLSGGRVIAGLAQGWLEDEFVATGVPTGRRGDGMADYIAALHAVWSPDPVRYTGRFYEIPESEIGPKPARPGGIPVLVAGSPPDFGLADQPGGGGATARAGRIAAGLNPYQVRRQGLAAEIDMFRTAARSAGHDPDGLPIVVRADGHLADTPSTAADRWLFTGTLAQWMDDLTWIGELGVRHVFIDIDAPLDVQLETMAQLRRHTA